MITNNRLTATHDEGHVPFLFRTEPVVSATGAALACPQCAGANLHLDAVQFAAPTNTHYTPTLGVSIDPDTGVTAESDEARQLHAGENRGPMLSIGYWCEDGCQGRIELREHKGNLFASLHNQAPMRPQDL